MIVLPPRGGVAAEGGGGGPNVSHNMPNREELLASKLLSLGVTLDVDRSFDLDTQRQLRRLGGIGQSMFRDAVLAYVLHHKQEGDELRDKSRRFLLLAHETNEIPRNLYHPNYTEAHRTGALSFVNWLATGEPATSLLAEAREFLTKYFLSSKTWDRKSADIDTPILLYTDSYELIRRMAESRGWTAIRGSPRASASLFQAALQVALAADDVERRELEDALKKRATKKLAGWFEKGLYDSIAYVLYALFPKPAAEPSQLFEIASDLVLP
jgi:hypothetical protein